MRLSSFGIAQAVFFLAIAVSWAPGASSALPVYFNDFDGGETFAAGATGGFSGAGAVESVQGYSALAPDFGGDFLRNIASGNPAAASTLTLSGLAPNASVTVDISLAIIDSWDGSTFPLAPGQAPDFFNVRINGSTAFSETFTNLSALGATQSYSGPALAQEVQLGWQQSDFRLDSAYLLSVSGFSDSSGNAVIDFFASGAGWHAIVPPDPEEETWAIDNVGVDSVVPEPSTGLLVTAGLLGLAGWRRRRD